MKKLLILLALLFPSISWAGTDVSLNQSDAALRDIPIFLEDLAGNPYTGSLSGFTITYRKPGAVSDTTKTLSSDGSGRYRLSLTSGEVDTTGVGWVTVQKDGTILLYVDPVRVISDSPNIQSILTNTSTSLTNESSISTSISSVASQVTNVQGRLPSSLDGGNMKSTVEAYASGQTPLQPTTPGRTLAVTASGNVGVDWSHVENPTSTVVLSGTTVATTTALSSTGNNAVRDALLNGSIDSTRTVRGILFRLNALTIGKATGLLSSTATYFAQDGVTKAVEATQNTDAGTRTAASSAAGD